MNYPELPTRFTLLHGDPETCHSFYDGIISHFEPGSTITIDLESPLIDAACSIFFNNNSLEINWNDFDFRKKPLPHSTNTTLTEWIESAKAHMRSEFSADILAQILLENYRANGYEDLCPHVIVRDLDSYYDANTIIARYPTLYVHLGPMMNVFHLSCRTIYVPNTDPRERVDYFINELKYEPKRSRNPDRDLRSGV